MHPCSPARVFPNFYAWAVQYCVGSCSTSVACMACRSSSSSLHPRLALVFLFHVSWRVSVSVTICCSAAPAAKSLVQVIIKGTAESNVSDGEKDNGNIDGGAKADSISEGSSAQGSNRHDADIPSNVDTQEDSHDDDSDSDDNDIDDNDIDDMRGSGSAGISTDAGERRSTHDNGSVHGATTVDAVAREPMAVTSAVTTTTPSRKRKNSADSNSSSHASDLDNSDLDDEDHGHVAKRSCVAPLATAAAFPPAASASTESGGTQISYVHSVSCCCSGV